MGATISGSRRLDGWLFALLALWVLATSPSLRVYYRVTVMEAEAFALAPDGRRRALPRLDDALWRQKSATLPAGDALALVEARLRQATRGSALWSRLPPGTRVEVRVHYGPTRQRLDREHVFTLEPDAGAR